MIQGFDEVHWELYKRCLIVELDFIAVSPSCSVVTLVVAAGPPPTQCTCDAIK